MYMKFSVVARPPPAATPQSATCRRRALLGCLFIGFRGKGIRVVARVELRRRNMIRYDMVVSPKKGNPNIDPKIVQSSFLGPPKWYP